MGRIDPPLARPDVTLTTADGEAFPFREATEGRLSLLFLGYTHCPDLCPVWLNAVARAKELVGSGPGSRPQVLFLGVDVARDTPAVLRQYLRRVDPAFVGLTGTPADVAATNAALGFGPIELGAPAADGDYEVGHTAKAIAFSPDGLGHRWYGYDVRADDLADDLPRLARRA
jgi:protein SCO1/2